MYLADIRACLARAGPGQRVLAQMGREFGEAAKGAVAQVVFEALDVGEMVAVVEAHQVKEISEHGVALADFFRHPAALGGEGEPAIGLVAEKTEFAEALDHD